MYVQSASTPAPGMRHSALVPFVHTHAAEPLVFTLCASGAHCHTGRGGGGGGGGGNKPPATVAITGKVPMPHSLSPAARRT